MFLSIILFFICTAEVSQINNSTCYNSDPFLAYSNCNSNITNFEEQHKKCYFYYLNQYNHFNFEPFQTPNIQIVPTSTPTSTSTNTPTNTSTPTNTQTNTNTPTKTPEYKKQPVSSPHNRNRWNSPPRLKPR